MCAPGGDKQAPLKPRASLGLSDQTEGTGSTLPLASRGSAKPRGSEDVREKTRDQFAQALAKAVEEAAAEGADPPGDPPRVAHDVEVALFKLFGRGTFHVSEKVSMRMRARMQVVCTHGICGCASICGWMVACLLEKVDLQRLSVRMCMSMSLCVRLCMHLHLYKCLRAFLVRMHDCLACACLCSACACVHVCYACACVYVDIRTSACL